VWVLLRSGSMIPTPLNYVPISCGHVCFQSVRLSLHRIDMTHPSHSPLLCFISIDVGPLLFSCLHSFPLPGRSSFTDTRAHGGLLYGEAFEPGFANFNTRCRQGKAGSDCYGLSEDLRSPATQWPGGQQSQFSGFISKCGVRVVRFVLFDAAMR
jgi:hypothetical protein